MVGKYKNIAIPMQHFEQPLVSDILLFLLKKKKKRKEKKIKVNKDNLHPTTEI